MRIADGIKYRQVVENIQNKQRGLHSIQSQVSSGKRVQRASEDPNAAAVIMQLRSAQRGAEQYRRNVDVALSRVEAEEVVLNQLSDALVRALELAVSQADDTANQTTRQQAKYEVDNLVHFVVNLGNTRFGEAYLFGGHQSDVAPFDPADPLRPRTPEELARLDQPHAIEITPGYRVPTNHNAKEVFLDTRVIEAIQALSAALGANDGAAVRQAMDGLKFASERVQDLIGDIGGRYNYLQITASSLDVHHLSITALRSEHEDADLAKAMVELVARQTGLQAAFLSTSAILSLNLTDFLR